MLALNKAYHENPRILIVDDDPFNILAIEAVLKRLDLKADSFYNGQEAVRAFE